MTTTKTATKQPKHELYAEVYDRLARLGTNTAILASVPTGWSAGVGRCGRRGEWWAEITPPHRAAIRAWAKTEKLALALALALGRKALLARRGA